MLQLKPTLLEITPYKFANKQGILISETSHAHIEKNTIGNNIKANIAYGGESAVDTIIYDNNIFGSKAEGIFVLESGFAWIW